MQMKYPELQQHQHTLLNVADHVVNHLLFNFLQTDAPYMVKRNRVISMIASRCSFEKTMDNFFCSNVTPDIIHCNDRANHHGVKIGTIIGYHRTKHVDIDDRIAATKQYIKATIIPRINDKLENKVCVN